MKKLLHSRRMKIFLIWLLFVAMLLAAKMLTKSALSDTIINNTISSTGGVLMVVIGGYGLRETAANLNNIFKSEGDKRS